MNKLVAYLIERHSLNSSGCQFNLRPASIRFKEYFDGECINDISLTPEEFREFNMSYYGQEKNH